MKKHLYILLLLTFSFTTYGQNDLNKSIKEVRKNQWTRLALYTGSVVLDAVGDAQNDQGNKELGHALNAASVASLIAIPVLHIPIKKIGAI